MCNLWCVIQNIKKEEKKQGVELRLGPYKGIMVIKLRCKQTNERSVFKVIFLCTQVIKSRGFPIRVTLNVKKPIITISYHNFSTL